MSREASTSARPRALTREDFDRWSPVVRRTAMVLGRRVPRSVSVADLCARGFAGLLDALASLEAMTHAPGDAEDYVQHRIRAAMVDHVMALGAGAREARQQSRRIALAIRALEAATGTPPSRERIAEVLGLGVAAYEETLRTIVKHGLARLEVLDLDAEDRAAVAEADEPPPAATLAEAIDRLPEMDRDLLMLVYQEDCSMEEAAGVLGTSEHRVVLQHAEIVHRLRAGLGKE